MYPQFTRVDIWTGHDRVTNLPFDCQQFGSQYRPGTKYSPQESQTISKRLASTNKKVTEVCQKVLCSIHAAKIIQLVACSKFT
jgi:hypothetical protein